MDSDEIVYVIKEPFGRYKIGRSCDFEKRLRHILMMMPYPPEYYILIPSTTATNLEHELHQKFSDKRRNGEWFELCDDDLYFIHANFDSEIVFPETSTGNSVHNVISSKCLICNKMFEQERFGRPRQYCSEAHRQKAYRDRRKLTRLTDYFQTKSPA